MRTLEREATERAAVALARHQPDSWIPVTSEVDQLIAAGAGLPGVLSMLSTAERPADAAGQQCDGDAQAYSLFDATSDSYPAELRAIAERPLLLYVRGNVPGSTMASLAIVGSREASRVGLATAYMTAARVASRGHTVVSGLAAGIDTAAHRGALSVDGVTVAVMGTGIDQIFPDENTDLADLIARKGAVVTQFAPGQGPSKTTFPARNALIAGLADASLLIELNEHSGTRIEAERTLEQGKPVWLWGPIMRTAAWARRFAEQPGVSFVDSIEQILEALRTLGNPEHSPPNNP